MRGLELARSYFEEFGLPMLEHDFAEVLPYLAVGLAGSGSECFGFDDDVSRDTPRPSLPIHPGRRSTLPALPLSMSAVTISAELKGASSQKSTSPEGAGSRSAQAQTTSTTRSRSRKA